MCKITITQISHVKQGIHLFSSDPTVVFASVCLALGGMCVFISCCAVLSPRWESSCVPLWVVFDFATCGETFHLLIFSWSSGPKQALQTHSNPPPATQWSPKLPDPSYILLNNNKYEFLLLRPDKAFWNKTHLFMSHFFLLLCYLTCCLSAGKNEPPKTCFTLFSSPLFIQGI